MKIGYLIILPFFFLVTRAPAQTSWVALPGAPNSWRFDDIFFLNPLKGWAINPIHSKVPPGQYARIFTTNDGGRTWIKLLDNSRTFFRAVGFADAQHGWVGNLGLYTADTNFMYSTADGGVSWQPVTAMATGSKPKGICGISVASDSVVYAYGRAGGPAQIIKSSNKGLSWDELYPGALTSSLIDGYFFHPDSGFVTGTYDTNMKGQILLTEDGGHSWHPVYQGSRPHEYVWKITFPSKMIGYATIQGSVTSRPDTSYFLKTTDGGRSWQEHLFRTDTFYKLQGIGFINDSTGWIGGDEHLPVTYKTTNGGQTWSADSTLGIDIPPYNSPKGFSINRFRRFGDSLMYAAGKTIYRFGNAPALGTQVFSRKQALVKLYPNPFSGYLEVDLKTFAPALNPHLTVYTLSGQVVLKQVPVREGLNRYTMPVLSPGIYVFRILSGSEELASGKLQAE